MLSENECKIILNKNRKNKLSDKEVNQVKIFLEGYAKMIINIDIEPNTINSNVHFFITKVIF